MYSDAMQRWIKNKFFPTDIRSRRIIFGPAAGLKLEIQPKSEFRFWLGVYEAELGKYFRRFAYTGARCFDVGGAEGYHSIVLAKLSGRGVLVFEPGAGWPEKIRNELSRNGLEGEVEQIRVGKELAEGVTTIDHMANKFFTPDFIKMDIEGAEADALSGATKVLSQRKPHLIVEVHGVEVENRCVDILKSHDYAPTIINPRSWFQEYRPIENNRWLVCEGRRGN
ncbi:FkbM family methyltransferase [Alphaproteobacteria bacterium]|nr:FkbM family methyltransferase [Alphaproteobacteria bacterium]